MIRILDEVARVLRPDKRHLPFGGVQMIFVGDFFQLSPVFTDADRVWTESVVKEYGQEEEGDDLVYDFAFEHPLWEKYIGTANVVLLRQNFRQVGEGILVSPLSPPPTAFRSAQGAPMMHL
jgi:ATP-dependent DNA helicase PIF1